MDASPAPALSASALHGQGLLPASVRSALWLAHQLGTAHAATVPSGFQALDAQLPGGGWPLAGLTELMPAAPGGGELALLAPALAQVSARGSQIVWVAPPHIPFAPALQALGVNLDRFTWIVPEHPLDAAWAVEQVLRSGTCAWVQWWSGKTTPEVLRRLHLAALDHQGLLLAVRPRAAQQQASPAPLRLACAPLPGRHLSVQILKRRGPASVLPVVLALPDPVPPRQRRHRLAGGLVAGSPSATAANPSATATSPSSTAASPEPVKFSGVAEQTVPGGPIKEQSAAVAQATASIRNAEWGPWDGMSGHGGIFHRLPDLEAGGPPQADPHVVAGPPSPQLAN